jgi:hypothetical protein
MLILLWGENLIMQNFKKVSDPNDIQKENLARKACRQKGLAQGP